MDSKQYIKSLKALKVKLEESKNKNFKDATKRLNNDLLINQYKKKIRDMVSKNLFGDENKLTKFETKLNKISNGVVLPSKIYSKSKNVFRVILTQNNNSNFNKPYTKKKD